jgi:hypothetical protein
MAWYYCSWQRELTDLNQWDIIVSHATDQLVVWKTDACWCIVPETNAVFWSRKMVLTREQKIFVVKHYFRNESYVFCQGDFQEAFPNDTVPKKTTVYRIITKFEETGSVCDRKHNRRRTVLNDNTLQDVRLSLLQSPSKSLRKLSQQKNMSLRSAYQAVRLLHLRAYCSRAMYELISKGLWPPMSPDLSLPDFFLWGHLKGHVCDSNPHTIEDLITNIS